MSSKCQVKHISNQSNQNRSVWVKWNHVIPIMLQPGRHPWHVLPDTMIKNASNKKRCWRTRRCPSLAYTRYISNRHGAWFRIALARGLIMNARKSSLLWRLSTQTYFQAIECQVNHLPIQLITKKEKWCWGDYGSSHISGQVNIKSTTFQFRSIKIRSVWIE